MPFGEGVGVRGDGTDVIQILKNLAVNAFQSSPQPKRVEISGEVLRTRLDLTLFKDGPNDRVLNVDCMDNTAPLVKFQVRDTGPGIPADEQAKIFQPFYRGSQGRRIVEGMGLGLSIAREIVEAHGGTLEVTSMAGKGSQFTIRLPQS